jgi:hypothetical protein
VANEQIKWCVSYEARRKDSDYSPNPQIFQTENAGKGEKCGKKFGEFDKSRYLCQEHRGTVHTKINWLMSKTDYIDILQGCSSKLRNDYGIKSLRLFGSVARGEDHEGSDVDVFVETETPNPFLLMDAKDYLERLVGRSVDIIRNHKNLNPRLRSRIERDGVAVF